MEQNFESMREVVEVLVTVRQVEGRGLVVLTNMVSEDWRKEEVSLWELARIYYGMNGDLTLVAWRKKAKLVSRLSTSSDSTPNRVPFSSATDNG